MLFRSPGCRNLRPLAAVNLELGMKTNEPTIEFLASTAPLKPHAPSPKSPLTPDQVTQLGRSLGHGLGLRAEMDREELDSLDFIARLIVTGARKEPTLLVSFLDPQAGDLGPGKGHTSHLFALFDKTDTGYVPTYRHVQSGDARTVEFQRDRKSTRLNSSH